MTCFFDGRNPMKYFFERKKPSNFFYLRNVFIVGKSGCEGSVSNRWGFNEANTRLKAVFALSQQLKLCWINSYRMQKCKNAHTIYFIIGCFARLSLFKPWGWHLKFHHENDISQNQLFSQKNLSAQRLQIIFGKNRWNK